MRILITGSSSGTKLGVHLLKKTKINWNVITSFQTSSAEWQNCPRVSKVSQAAHVGDTDMVDSDQPLVIEVIALSFFERGWVKEYLSAAKNVIVIVSSPIHFMDKKLLSTFDRLLITKTLSPEKQSQYYTLFVNTKSMNTLEFKRTVKALDEKQYLEVKDGVVSVVQWVDPEDKSSIKSDVEEKIPLQGLKPALHNKSKQSFDKVSPSAVSVVNESTDILQVLPSDYYMAQAPPPMIKSVASPDKFAKGAVVSELVEEKHVSEEIQDFPSRMVSKKSIPGTVPSEHISEFWVTFTPMSENLGTPVDIVECTASFEEMVSNDLIISMIATTCKKQSNEVVEFYFHVYKQRQDLFVTLMMNILQSLRVNRLISTGSIMI